MKLLFVCTGNTCRSPMAEALMKRIMHDKSENSDQAGGETVISSAGIQAWPGQPASEQAIKVLKQVYDIELDSHRSQRVNPELVEISDWVITMTVAQRDMIQRLFPEFEAKIKTLGELAGNPGEDIEDPFGGSFASYEQTAGIIYRLLLNLIERLGL